MIDQMIAAIYTVYAADSSSESTSNETGHGFDKAANLLTCRNMLNGLMYTASLSDDEDLRFRIREVGSFFTSN